MKKWIMILLAAGFSVPAFADDFGDRFDGQAPTALEDTQSLTEIEPAAGSPAQAETQQAETELEQEFQTEVNSSTRDLGDGQTEHRDSVGDGKLRVFYENNADDRVMDSDDAAGVEMKVLEFE